MEINEKGFVGLDPSKAKNNIYDFNNQVQFAYNAFSSAINDLLVQLYTNWCSPKAVDFYNKLNNSVNEINNDINTIVTKIGNDVCEAYNSVAYANGLETIWVTPYLTMKNSYLELLGASKDGTVGMKITKVREILQNFEKRMRDVINEFNSLPTAIALYDDENGMQQYYSINVRELGNIVEEYITGLINEVNNIINEEIVSTISSKNKSVEILKQ